MTHILLIEKDDALRNNWKELFRFLKYQVTVLETIGNITSINQITGKSYCNIKVIVADTDVVGLDGLKLKQLFNNDVHRIPIVFISAENVPNYSLERDELSAISFLRKPFDNGVLIEYVNKAIRVKSLFDENEDANKAIAHLVINQKDKLPLELPLKRSYSFGRFRGSDVYHADVQLFNPSASRKHAYLIRVFKDKESYYKMIDFSSNGIVLNGKKSAKIERLRHQDVIEFYPGCVATYTEIEREQLDLDTTLTS